MCLGFFLDLSFSGIYRFPDPKKQQPQKHTKNNNNNNNNNNRNTNTNSAADVDAHFLSKLCFSQSND